MERKPIKGIYYKTKNAKDGLCYRVLSLNHVNTRKGYFKVKVEWYSILSGVFWGNYYGLPRHWKIPFGVFDNHESFWPRWA